MILFSLTATLASIGAAGIPQAGDQQTMICLMNKANENNGYLEIISPQTIAK